MLESLFFAVATLQNETPLRERRIPPRTSLRSRSQCAYPAEGAAIAPPFDTDAMSHSSAYVSPGSNRRRNTLATTCLSPPPARRYALQFSCHRQRWPSEHTLSQIASRSSRPMPRSNARAERKIVSPSGTPIAPRARTQTPPVPERPETSTSGADDSPSVMREIRRPARIARESVPQSEYRSPLPATNLRGGRSRHLQILLPKVDQKIC